MMTYTLNNEKKAIEELELDELDIVSGGGIVSILKKGEDIIKHLFD